VNHTCDWFLRHTHLNHLASHVAVRHSAHCCIELTTGNDAIVVAIRHVECHASVELVTRDNAISVDVKLGESSVCGGGHC